MSRPRRPPAPACGAGGAVGPSGRVAPEGSDYGEVVMSETHRRAARLGVIVAAWIGLGPGCGGEPPPPADQAVEITPAMETMKQEMIKSMQSKGMKMPNAPKAK